MKRTAATIGILGLLAYPAVGFAADTSQCWQVQPKASAEGWTQWVSPNGMSYETPTNWDTDRAYQELAAAGLCDVTKSVPGVTSSETVTEPVTTELQGVAGSSTEPATSELRARLDKNLGGNSVTNEPTGGGQEDDWGSIIFALVALGAMGATAKDYVVDPVADLARDPSVLPSMGRQHQPQGLFRVNPAPSSAQYIIPTEAPIFEPMPRPAEVSRVVDVPYVTVPHQSASAAADQDNEWVSPSQKAPVDVAQILASQERPTFIVGPDRVGKGMTVQFAYRAMRAKGYQVWLIQPKPAPQEKHYWADCDEVLSFNLSDTTEQESAPEHQALQKDVRAFIGAYRQAAGDKKLLILDELFMVSQVWPDFTKKFLKGVIAQETSSGVTYGRLLWTITQNGQLGDIGISGGSRSLFDLVAIQRPDSGPHLEALSRSYTGLPGIDPSLFEMSESPKKTVIYHSAVGEWLPMVAYSTSSSGEPTPEQVLAVRWALDEGQSDSQIIKDVLGCKGRNYEDGRTLLSKIRKHYEPA